MILQSQRLHNSDARLQVSHRRLLIHDCSKVKGLNNIVPGLKMGQHIVAARFIAKEMLASSGAYPIIMRKKQTRTFIAKVPFALVICINDGAILGITKYITGTAF